MLSSDWLEAAEGKEGYWNDVGVELFAGYSKRDVLLTLHWHSSWGSQVHQRAPEVIEDGCPGIRLQTL